MSAKESVSSETNASETVELPCGHVIRPCCELSFTEQLAQVFHHPLISLETAPSPDDHMYALRAFALLYLFFFMAGMTMGAVIMSLAERLP